MESITVKPSLQTIFFDDIGDNNTTSDDAPVKIASVSTAAPSAFDVMKRASRLPPAPNSTQSLSDSRQYNQTVLTQLQRYCLSLHSISNHRLFNSALDDCDDISVGAMWIDGSTSFRPAEKGERKQFARSIGKRVGEFNDSDFRQCGAIKAIAIVFNFTRPHSTDNKLFSLPLCNVSPQISSECRTSLHHLLLRFLTIERKQKLMFEAKEALCALLHYCHLTRFIQRDVSGLVDIKIAVWLFDPDAKTHLSIVNVRDKFKVNAATSDISAQGDTSAEVSTFLSDLSSIASIWSSVSSSLTANSLTSAFYDQEMRMVPILVEMQLTGIRFNEKPFVEIAESTSSRLLSIIRQAQAIVHAQAPNAVIDIGSPQSVSKCLFETLKYPLVISTERGRTEKKGDTPSVNEAVLESLMQQCEPEQRQLIQLIIDYRKTKKVETTYCKAFVEHAEDVCGTKEYRVPHKRMYCCWKQTSAATGRLSASQPNLQSLPRGDRAVGSNIACDDDTMDDVEVSETVSISIRDSFTVSDSSSWLLLSADYNQMEMRILAIFCGDEKTDRTLLSTRR